MLQQKILYENKKQIFFSPTQHPDIILLHTFLQFCVITFGGEITVFSEKFGSARL